MERQDGNTKTSTDNASDRNHEHGVSKPNANTVLDSSNQGLSASQVTRCEECCDCKDCLEYTCEDSPCHHDCGECSGCEEARLDAQEDEYNWRLSQGTL